MIRQALGWAAGLACLLAAPASATVLETGTPAAAWSAALEGSPAPRQRHDDGTAALRFDLPFSRLRGERFAWDKVGRWDLSKAERLTVRMRSGGGAAQVLLYCRSGAGWYRLPPLVPGPRWREVELDRHQAVVEGSPEGWGHIDGLRVAVEPGVVGDTWVDLGRVEAQRGLREEAVWRAGHTSGKEAVFGLILEQARGQAYTDARHRLSAADGILAKAAEHGLGGSARARALRAAHAKVTEAYALSLPPRRQALRAVWVHNGDGVRARGGERALRWKDALPEMAAQGINAVLPNLLWPGAAYYPGTVVAAVPGVAVEGDYLRELLDAAKPLGMQVHVWVSVWRLPEGWAGLEGAAEPFRQQGRLQLDASGHELGWLCPCDERNRQYALDALRDLATRYAVDGVQLDYMRFDSPQAGFGPACRARFEAFNGRPVERWPQDCAPGGPLAQAYGLFKREVVSSFVRDASRVLRAARPGLTVSAAVIPDIEAARQQVSQDWTRWVDEGWIDLAFPMLYTQDSGGFQVSVKALAAQVGARRLVPGVQAILDDGRGAPLDTVADEAAAAAGLGTRGVALFEWREQLQDSLLPFLANGLWRQGPYDLRFRAIPPGQEAPLVTPGRPPKGLPKTLWVDDFEAPGLVNRLGGIWAAEQDHLGTGTRLLELPLAPVSPGAGGSKACLGLKGHIGPSHAPWPWAALATGLDGEGRGLDLSDYHTLVFQARGDGKAVELLLRRDSVKDGGDPRVGFRPQADWREIRVDLEDLAQPRWAEPVERGREDVRGIAFQPGSRDDQDFWFQIDNVRFER